MGQSFQNLREYLRYTRLPLHRRSLVVYSEGAAYWPHLGPVVRALLARFDGYIAYVSSAADDPGVALTHPRLTTYVIGDGYVRTLFFSALQADVLLMTMPDLNTFHIKRSVATKHYVYLHHSLVSSHMAYREGAFDHFDTILCAGPHHEAEIRATERLKGQKPKHLVRHGYGRLDAILAAARDDSLLTGCPMVLVAPSWGPHGLLEVHAEGLLQVLANTPWDVVIRPHPQTVRLAPKALATVQRWCERAPNLKLETSVVGYDSLLRASAMVSDWSGAAFDYALGLERPVLFVDVPRKINNIHYGLVDIEPIEVFGRMQMGRVIGVDELARLPEHLRHLLAEREVQCEALRAFRERWVFNVGGSADTAADCLMQLVDSVAAY